MNEARMCQLGALLNEMLGLAPSAKPKLRVVGKSVTAHATPAETFHDASVSVSDFTQRWRNRLATLSEIEDVDVLLGMRRLLTEKMQAVEAQA